MMFFLLCSLQDIGNKSEVILKQMSHFSVGLLNRGKLVKENRLLLHIILGLVWWKETKKSALCRDFWPLYNRSSKLATETQQEHLAPGIFFAFFMNENVLLPMLRVSLSGFLRIDRRRSVALGRVSSYVLARMYIAKVVGAAGCCCTTVY